MVLAQLLVSGLLLGGVYALISVGLTLIFGVLRVINFAHGEFLMVGMYITYWLFTLYGVDPYVSLFVVPVVLFALGMVVYAVIVRRTIGAPSVVQTFATAGLSIALQNLALMLWNGDFRSIQAPLASSTVTLAGVTVSLPRLVAFLVAMSLAGALYAFLQYTYTGKAIRATALDRNVAQLMGVNIHRIYLLTFALGIALVGVAGPLLMPIYYVNPTVGLHFVIIAFVVVVLGGLGSLGGAVLGGLLIGLVETLSGYYIGTSWQQALYFLIFLLVLILRPSGLFGIRGAEEVGLK